MKTQTRIGISVAALLLAGGTMLAVAGSDDDCRGKGGLGYGGMGYLNSGGDGSMMGQGYGRHGGDYDPAKMQQKMLQRLDQQLSLTDQQQQQIGDLMAQHQQQMPANRAQMQQFRLQMHNLDPAAADYSRQVEALAAEQSALMSQKMVERAKHHAELYALLTPEQQQAFRQLEQQRGERRGGHHRMW